MGYTWPYYVKAMYTHEISIGNKIPRPNSWGDTLESHVESKTHPPSTKDQNHPSLHLRWSLIELFDRIPWCLPASLGLKPPTPWSWLLCRFRRWFFFAYDMRQWYTQQWNIANYSNSLTWNLQPSYLGMIPHIINHDSRWFQASGEQNGDLALVCWWSCYREHRLNHNNPTYQKKTAQKRNHGWFCDVLWM